MFGRGEHTVLSQLGNLAAPVAKSVNISTGEVGTNQQKIINTNIPGARAAKNNQHMKVAIDDRQYGYQTVANVLEYVKTGKDKKIRQPH